MDKKLIYPLLFWGAMLLVSIATLVSLDGMPKVKTFSNVDKVIHLIFFLGLTILFYFAYPKINRWIVLASMAFYGIAIEFLQEWLPSGRSFDINDWYFDVIGALLAVIICYYTPVADALKQGINRMLFKSTS